MLLASASPRRRELLALAGIRFEAVSTEVEELTDGEPWKLVVENALRKARAGRASHPGHDLVLGADTDVAVEGRTLGKPADPEQARESLLRLSGRTHEVLGGIALIDAEGRERSALERTRVQFAELDPELVALYVASGEWRDRAGGYAVQGLGSALVTMIDGDVANVIGLPIRALLALEPGLITSG